MSEEQAETPQVDAAQVDVPQVETPQVETPPVPDAVAAPNPEPKRERVVVTKLEMKPDIKPEQRPAERPERGNRENRPPREGGRPPGQGGNRPPQNRPDQKPGDRPRGAGDRGPDRGGERRDGKPAGRDDRRPGGAGRFDAPQEIDLEKLIGDSLYLDNQAHGVVSRIRDMDSGTRSQLRRLYGAVRRATRAPENERQHEFVMLRARLAYTIARHGLRSLDQIERLLLQVTRKNEARGYERFRDLFEAIVAYNE